MAGSPANLLDFLAQINLTELHDRFVAEDIDLMTLSLLDKDDFKELGLSLGQRKRLLSGLDALGLRKTEVARPAERTNENPVQLRRLSVMFCDMVGSTELGEYLGIDEMQTVLQHYYAIANTIAQRHGGHLATSQGDGLVILFGYPRVLDGFAERCVLAARDLQKKLADSPVLIEDHNSIHIATRIGIASGQAAVGMAANDVPGDHMHLVGPVVNRAARLQSVAHPQSIAVDSKTHNLTRKSVLYAEVEHHTLKGLPEPADVYHVIELRQTDDATALPVTLIGREAETAILSTLWAQAKAGSGATVTISGDAGIGKSTLVQSFIAAHVAPQARVVHLLCTAMAAQSPLGPVAHAVNALTKQGDNQQSLAGLLNHPSPEMVQRTAQLLGMSGPENRNPMISKSDRAAILDLLSGWIIHDAKSPTALVVENAQWADETTRELLLRTAQRARGEGAPLLMITVTREDITDMVFDDSNHVALPIPPLDSVQSTALLSRILADKPMPQSVRQNILYHADGNPLMLEALGQAQVQQQLPEVADAVVVPHTIYESVSKRLDSISAGRNVIEALAVLGMPASQDVLSEVLQRDTQDIGQALEALEHAGLVAREVHLGREEISIRHKAYRDVIYEQIAGQSRRDLHKAAYRALSDRCDIRPEVLANHAQAAHDWKNAAVHALDAGDAFLKRSALIEAGHFLEMANTSLKRVDTTSQVTENRLRAITGLASVERARFGIATDKSADLGRQAVQLAREIGDVKAELLALNGLYSHALVHADYPKAEEYAQALLETANLSQNKTFAMIGTRAIGAVALHTGDQTLAVGNLTKALEQYDRDEHVSLAHAHGYDHAEICAALLAMSHWIRGDLQQSRHFGAWSIDHSRQIDHAHSLAQAISFRVMWGAMARHGSELQELGAEGLEVAETNGIRVMRAAARLFPFLTQLCLRPDPPTESEMADLAQRVDEFRAVNPYNYGPLLATVLAEAYVREGDLSGAETVLSDAAKTEIRTGEIWTSSEVLRMRARVAQERGDHAVAGDLRREALECARSTQALTIALRITCDMAEANPCADTTQAIQEALSNLVSKDQGWDIRRANALLQAGQGA